MIHTSSSLDISAQVEAVRQSQRAAYRMSFTGCPDCGRPLSIEEHCVPCGRQVNPKEYRNERAAS